MTTRIRSLGTELFYHQRQLYRYRKRSHLRGRGRSIGGGRGFEVGPLGRWGCPPPSPILSVMGIPPNDLGARAVIGVDGAVWSANSAFCSLVGLEEPALRHVGWRELLHSADRRYVAAHLVEVLAGGDRLREFDARFLPPDGRDVPAHIRVELVRDSDGRQGWFLVEAWATT